VKEAKIIPNDNGPGFQDPSWKELNKRKVLEYIAQHMEGVHPYQIKEEAGITPEPTRQTIHNYLNELMNEHKVYKNKKNGRYCVSDLDLGIAHMFSQYMDSACHVMLDKIYNKRPVSRSSGIAGNPDPSFVELSNTMSADAVSKKYCRTRFDENSSNEKYFFEFANRIGVYITYIFIAAINMSIKEQMNLADKQKQNKENYPRRSVEELRSVLFHKSIDIDSIFEDFKSLLQSISTSDSKISVDLDAFKRVYPDIYKGLQNNWHNEVRDHSNWVGAREQAGVHCDHKWEQLSIIMLPEKYYFCRECYDVIDEKHMNKISK
jgi:uncharacterized membrane-anchored protein YhcB (DUF1043 family)